MAWHSDISLTCQQAGLLMSLHVRGDPELSCEQRRAFEAHLAACPSCAAECEQDRQLVALLRRHWPSGEGICASGQATPYWPMTVQEGWEDLKCRCPSLAQACRNSEREKRRQLLFRRMRPIAAAACLVLAVGIGWTVLRSGRPARPGGVAVNHSQPEGAFAEFITPRGRTPLPLGTPVKTDESPREVLLGGMHRVVMNRDAEATFSAVGDPACQAGASSPAKLTYEIRLSRGELYVEVVPGNPLTVQTPNALLAVLGTKFDVLARDGRTELVLLKGSVRFSGLAGEAGGPAGRSVDVPAGHVSVIAGMSGPSAPRQTDALAATAWARELAFTNAIALAHPNADLHLLDSIRDCWPSAKAPDLNTIDYVTWRDAHRDWFAREFPWIFKAQRALKDQRGLDVDYIELLMVSGDIWQFHYPRPVGEPTPVIDPAGIRRIAEHYGADGAALWRDVQPSPADPMRRAPATAADSSGGDNNNTAQAWLSAMDAWRSGVASEADHPNHFPAALLLSSLEAASYLANTRTAAWLWVSEHPDKARALLAEGDYRARCMPRRMPGQSITASALAARLADQAAAARKATQAVQDLFMTVATKNETGCGTASAAAAEQLQEYLSAFAEEQER